MQVAKVAAFAATFDDFTTASSFELFEAASMATRASAQEFMRKTLAGIFILELQGSSVRKINIWRWNSVYMD